MRNTYEELEQNLIDVLGFCGCGQPDQVLDLVGQALQLLADKSEFVWTKKEMSTEEWWSKCKKVLHTSGIETFVWYVLDEKGLTEHGGSVPGWLTKKGQDFLSDLNEWKALYMLIEMEEKPQISTFIDEVSYTYGYGKLSTLGEFEFPLRKEWFEQYKRERIVATVKGINHEN